MPKFNVDEVTLIAGQELTTAPGTPDGTWGTFLFPPTGLLGYKGSLELVGSIIASQIGSAINRPDRVYQIGISMPSGASVVNDDDGQPTIIEDPYLEGLDYSVHFRGIEYMIKGDEWQNDVVGGGFRWTNGQIFEDGQIITVSFKPEISNVISTPDAVARFLDSSGIALVTATSTLTAASQRKLIFIQGATAVVTVTLDEDYPEGVLCAILTGNGTGGSQKQTTISAPAGQDIWQDGVKTSFFLGTSEWAYLVRIGTRWYVTSMSDNWQRVGDMVPGLIPGANKIAANRQVLQENEYPRLTERLIAAEASLPGSVVSAAQQAANPTKWARGGGQIWVPRPGGYFLRWLDLGAGVDPDRSNSEANQIGSAQMWALFSHTHPISNDSGDNIVARKPGSTGGGLGLNAAAGGFERMLTHFVQPPLLPGQISTNENRPINAAYPCLIYV